MTDLAGHELGQYQIVEQIAKGGMSTVYRARQRSMGRDVAIKVLPPSLMHDDTFMQRFYREVDVVARLQHPHILPVYDFGLHEGLPYIVMAYISGGTLADILQDGPMNPADTVRMVRQIADALDYAHRKGIVHRDFKPGNVLLDDHLNPYLTDFGLAKINESSAQITGMTILGTPSYMAPEQTEPGDVTASADIYALGVTVFQMLTGRVPYEAQTPLAILMAHVTQPIPDIRQARPDLPDALHTFMAQAMAKSAEDRFKTAAELASALARAMEGGGGETSDSFETLPALLMTNMVGQVIFLDQTCLKLLKRHHHEARTIIGKPLHDVLGFNRGVTDHLMQEISAKGGFENLTLELHDARGTAFTALCSAAATRDEKGNFVGADISLKPVSGTPGAPFVIDFDTIDKRLNTIEETYMQTYFRIQMEGIHRLLVQMGGPRLGKHLENMINETAQRNVWPVSIQNGRVTVELRNSDADIYRALLVKAISYAVSVMGKRMVAKQVQTAENRLDAKLIQFVNELGIGDLYKDLL